MIEPCLIGIRVSASSWSTMTWPSCLPRALAADGLVPNLREAMAGLLPVRQAQLRGRAPEGDRVLGVRETRAA